MGIWGKIIDFFTIYNLDVSDILNPIKYYSVKAKFSQTNRYRTINIEAVDQEDCKRQVLVQGYLEPLEITQIKIGPTEPQADFMKNLKIKYSDDIDVSIASILISRCDSNDDYNNAPKDLIKYAKLKNVFSSIYDGEKTLLNRIFNNSSQLEKIELFVFYVFKYKMEIKECNLETSQFGDVIKKIAKELHENKSFISSLEKFSGDDLVKFGDAENDSYGKLKGGIYTKAYKEVIKRLKENNLVFF